MDDANRRSTGDRSHFWPLAQPDSGSRGPVGDFRPAGQDGAANGKLRCPFEHAKADHDYAERFDQAMTSYSAAQSAQILEALRGTDISEVRVFCDVAGGHGYMTCALLGAYPQLSGIVLDLPHVVIDSDATVGPKVRTGGALPLCRWGYVQA
jgi:O-methyltransferase domain